MKESVLVFTLSMPNIGSWNGTWTGAHKKHVRRRMFGRSNAAHDKAQKIADKAQFYYNFGDGWGANVSVEKMDLKDSTKAIKGSNGFCGYDWMIDSIIEHGKIISE